jgi:hypothetical protein
VDMDKLAQRFIRPAIEAHRVPCNGWHGFRHGIASNLDALGANDKVVQRICQGLGAEVSRRR